MTFNKIEPDFVTAGCHIRSECKRESDSKYFKELFEREWDAFVIKYDENTGKLRSFIECCGRLAWELENGKRFTSASCC